MKATFPNQPYASISVDRYDFTLARLSFLIRRWVWQMCHEMSISPSFANIIGHNGYWSLVPIAVNMYADL